MSKTGKLRPGDFRQDDAWMMDITKTALNSLSISLDYDKDPKDRYPVLLLIPDTDNPDHSHIKLTRKQAERLHDWLGKYLGT